MAAEKYWMGTPPGVCDLDEKPLVEEFVDGKTRMGPWGNMCPDCHRMYGFGIGVGRGQRYRKQPDGRWLKTEG